MDENDTDTTVDKTLPRHRIRKCKECGKRLGSTVGKCFECGGEDPSPSREERLENAWTWKILLGVDPELIEEAHEE